MTTTATNIIDATAIFAGIRITARTRTREIIAEPIAQTFSRPISEADAQRNAEAIALHTKLSELKAAVWDTAANVVTTERHMPRKELAALARKAFKAHGIKGVSVTAPNYSMAQSVNVSYSERNDYTFSDAGFYDRAEGDAASAMNRELHEMIESFLLACFPGTDNRSDYASDHFDYKWSIR